MAVSSVLVQHLPQALPGCAFTETDLCVRMCGADGTRSGGDSCQRSRSRGEGRGSREVADDGREEGHGPTDAT